MSAAPGSTSTARISTSGTAKKGRLEDAVSSYGFGVTINLMGIDLNWDFAQLWDFKDSLDDSFGTQFWIGTRF